MVKLFFIIAATICFSQTYAQAKQNKIKQVENGLLPWVQFTDSPVIKYNIKDRMKLYNVPAVSVAVIDNGKIEWAKTWSLYDSVTINENTLFQAGSISKSFNAVAVMQLVQEGKLALDKDIRGYLKTWKFPDNQFSQSKKITLKNLLSHTAGLNLHGFGGYEPGDTIPAINDILNGASPAHTEAIKPIMKPDSVHEYSGGGTTIIQKILLDNFTNDYNQFVSSRVVRPSGMKQSSFLPPSPNANVAYGHSWRGELIKGKYRIHPEMAAAALWTNPTELARFVLAIQKCLAGKKGALLDSSIANLMLTPYLKNSDAALGFFIIDKKGEKYFNHNGGTEGYRSKMYGSFKDGKGFIVMANCNDTRIIEELESAITEIYQWKDFYQPKIKTIHSVAADTLKLMAGEYYFDKLSATFSIRYTGQGLELKWSKYSYQPIYAISNDEFTATFDPYVFYKFSTVDGTLTIKAGSDVFVGKKK